MRLRKVFMIPLCVASLLSVAVVAAGEQQERPALVGQRSQGQTADQTLAACVAIECQEEVALAKFVQDKSENKDVKAFAKKMIEDHQACLQKLQQFAPEATREGYLAEKSRSARDDSARTSSTKSGVEQAKGTSKAGERAIQQTNATQENTAARSGQSVDFLQLHKEVAQECLAASKEALGKKTGAEMDQCFIGFQIAKHAAMKTKLTVFQRHASDELAQVFAQGAETCGEHMKEAETIMKKLDTSDSKPRREERREERRENKN